MRKIRALVKQHIQEIIALQRGLYQHPELQFEEFRTTEKVAIVLDQLGIICHKTEPTGLITKIVGGKPDRMVMLRVDMDALPVQELNEDLVYKSLEAGKVHVYGHDSHAAMLVTAVKVLKEIQEKLQETVRLTFRPSEEGAQNAKAMVAQGAMTSVDDVSGLHIWSQVPVGTASYRVGSSFASADIFSVGFKGRGDHSTIPNACIDAAVIASSFMVDLQAIVFRETDPLDPVVVMIGRMDMGTRFNVIAENARLGGTVRRSSIATRDRVERALRRYAEQTAAICGRVASLDYQYEALSVINDERDTLFAQALIKENFGKAALRQEEPTAGGKDFSHCTEYASGCFTLVGNGNPEKDTERAHYHGRFNIGEDAMAVGVELYAQYAFEYLKAYFWKKISNFLLRENEKLFL